MTRSRRALSASTLFAILPALVFIPPAAAQAPATGGPGTGAAGGAAPGSSPPGANAPAPGVAGGVATAPPNHPLTLADVVARAVGGNAAPGDATPAPNAPPPPNNAPPANAAPGGARVGATGQGASLPSIVAGHMTDLEPAPETRMASVEENARAWPQDTTTGGGTGGGPTGPITVGASGAIRGERNNYAARLSAGHSIDLFGLLPAARDAQKDVRDFHSLDIERRQNETALAQLVRATGGR